jgi:ATP-dependent DNA helicase DinG
MAEAVAAVLDSGGTLLVGAGTGTGKTLAYLIPAILSRNRVLVSTGTKTLQEQIFFKDLPVLREALGATFTATYMKGRGNYLCLHRFEAWRQDGLLATSDEAHYMQMIGEWSRETTTGDRAELEDLPEDAPFWNDIAASADNCIGTECARYQDCFVTRMRQRAAEADVVIVNHHLLCADAALRHSAYGEVIPDCHYAVVDEAHQLEEVATQYFGRSVGTYRIEDLARDVDRATHSNVIADPDQAADLQLHVSRIRDHARMFFAALQMLRVDGAAAPAAESRIRIRPAHMATVGDEGLALIGALEAVEADIALTKDASEEVLALARRSAVFSGSAPARLSAINCRAGTTRQPIKTCRFRETKLSSNANVWNSKSSSGAERNINSSL